jgi:hypothetical protein
MTILKIRTDRRTLLKGLAAIPFVAIAGRHGRVEAEMVSVDDPIAKNLGYVEVSATAGQTCANCKLYAGGDAPTGGCPLFGT